MSLLNQLLANCQFQFPCPIESDPEGLGLIAMGADLAPETLITAYSQGLFPWFNEDEPIAWWSPEPRCVIVPNDYQPSKSLRRTARNSAWQITLNQAFDEVIHACSLPRSYSEDTWIHEEMIEAYLSLHELGFAHSIEVWQLTATKRQLIGGLYGLKIGRIYFGESMFHRVTDASKVAFWALMRLCEDSDMPLVDCQLPNPHLISLGAKTLPRQQFLSLLSLLINPVVDKTLTPNSETTTSPHQTLNWKTHHFAPLYSEQLLQNQGSVWLSSD